jgi:carbamoyltransferase
MLVLGISDLEHDSAVAVLDGSRPVAAIEEDKLNRTPTAGGLPQLALSQCLRQAGAGRRDVSLVAMASRPVRSWLREERFRFGLLVMRPAASYGTGALGRISRGLNHLRFLRQLFGPQTALVNYEHHLCHAASAYYASEFDRALVLTLDESGDMWSGLLAIGEAAELRVLRPLRFPNSLGWFYTQVTELLGFRPRRDEHKTQWLSKEGTADFIGVFRKLLTRGSDGLPVLNRRYFGERAGARWALSEEFCRELQVSEPATPPKGALRAAIARSAQEFLEETVVELAETYRKKTGTKYLCLAGGVFLNVLLVRALEMRTGFAKLFVQPVSGNPGTALGAAYLAGQGLAAAREREPLAHVYLGPQYEAGEMKAVLDNCKIIYRFLPNEEELLAETVRLLQQDKIVAWYQGRLEFGLRALGNRSILASPFSPYVIENLNQYIKHREDFHPFALSVPSESTPALFDCTANCRFLASIGTLREPVPGLDRFAFKGKEVRVHTVEKAVNPRFWDLIDKFGAQAPAPVLVNTSFNLFGEPLVCDPREAVRSFYCAGIDALVMGNFLVVK